MVSEIYTYFYQSFTSEFYFNLLLVFKAVYLLSDVEFIAEIYC